MDRLIDLAESFVNYASRIKEYTPALAKLYREGRFEDAGEQTIYLMEGVEWMISAATILGSRVDFDKECLLEISRKLYRFFNNKDSNALADILQYDIIEISDEIEKKYGEFISNSMN